MTLKQMLLLALVIFLLANAQYLPIPYLMKYMGAFQFTITFLLFLLFIVSFASGVLRLLFDGIRLLMNRHYKVHFMRVAILAIYIPGVIIISFMLGQLFLVDINRDIAIRHAKPLIQDIETYKHKHGTYPDNIDVLKYDTGVANADAYRYYKTDSTGYKVYFLAMELGGFETIHVEYNRSAPNHSNRPGTTFLKGEDKGWFYYPKY